MTGNYSQELRNTTAGFKHRFRKISVGDIPQCEGFLSRPRPDDIRDLTIYDCNLNGDVPRNKIIFLILFNSFLQNIANK